LLDLAALGAASKARLLVEEARRRAAPTTSPHPLLCRHLLEWRLQGVLLLLLQLLLLQL